MRPVWMWTAESHLDLQDSVVHSAEWLCEGGLCCLGHGRMVSLLYKIYHSADHLRDEYLRHVFAISNTRASAVLDVFALVIPCCRTDHFSHFKLATVGRVKG